jgi:plastocyanin
VADPEQLYQEVLQEEQQKGSSGPVAEGRAKAARARAEAGSPHPKEPKWWPGSQPHFEGDGHGAEEPAEEPAAEAPAEEPAAEAAPEPEPAEQPAAQAPAEQPAAQAPAEQPAAQAPAEQPAAQAAEQPAAQVPAEQPAAQAPAQPPAEGGGVAVATRPTVGVTHGTVSGNRLRPEDAVATEAQFAGQRAVYDRRKLIDELVATGVPAVAASDTGRPRAPWLSVLYLLIPVLVIAFLVANGDQQEAAAPEPPPATGGGGGGVATDTLVAADTQFDADTIELKANRPTDFTIENEDSALHNLVIFPSEEEAADSSSALFKSPDATGGSTTEFTIDPLKKGEYYFNCQYHANMNGTVEVT